MTIVATYPDSTKSSLEQRLRARARERWPQIASLQIRHRGNFSYADATLTDGTTLKLCRLRYVGSASQWQFAIYRASHDDYDESAFFTGLPVGTCQDALDTACGLYLNDPTAWTRPPTNLQTRPLSRAPSRWDSRCGRASSGKAATSLNRPSPPSIAGLVEPWSGEERFVSLRSVRLYRTGTRRIRPDRTRDPLDGGWSDLYEFDGDPGLSSAGTRIPDEANAFADSSQTGPAAEGS
jgi:hypothetical protein